QKPGYGGHRLFHARDWRYGRQDGNRLIHPGERTQSESAVASSPRPAMSSLRYELRRWYSTVFGVTNRAWAISRLLCPAAASSAIRGSLGVSAAGPLSSTSRRGRATVAASSVRARS